MKKILFGLLALVSLSVFADTYNCTLNTDMGTIFDSQTGDVTHMMRLVLKMY
jgi:hypothetical protein